MTEERLVLVSPLHEHFRFWHLVRVVAEMRVRGAPTIRAYRDGEVWHAREGTHRLRAARALGIAPVLVSVPWGRSPAALVRARFRAARHAHLFPLVRVVS